MQISGERKREARARGPPIAASLAWVTLFGIHTCAMYAFTTGDKS
jgi:hypothetical protein